MNTGAPFVLRKAERKRYVMGFFSSSITILQTLVTAIGAGLGVWGVINLLEGYPCVNIIRQGDLCIARRI